MREKIMGREFIWSVHSDMLVLSAIVLKWTQKFIGESSDDSVERQQTLYKVVYFLSNAKRISFDSGSENRGAKSDRNLLIINLWK